jgi:hypothetical protein
MPNWIFAISLSGSRPFFAARIPCPGLVVFPHTVCGALANIQMPNSVIAKPVNFFYTLHLVYGQKSEYKKIYLHICH